MPPDSRLRWPNLFVVGAAKAGTTSLHSYLAASPHVFMSEMKEPHLFADVHVSGTWSMVADEAEYLALFESWAEEPFAGEASPSYIWDPESAGRIHAVSPDARIIMMLRDPIKRAHSHFLMDVREGRASGDFLAALRADYGREDKGWGISHLYVELGLYADAIERFRSTFGENQVCIVIFEEFVQDLPKSLAGIAAFLQLPGDAFANAATDTVLNPFQEPRIAWLRRMIGSSYFAGIRKRIPRGLRELGRRVILRKGAPPVLEPDAAAFLEELCRDDVRRIETLLDRSLPWEIAGSKLSP